MTERSSLKNSCSIVSEESSEVSGSKYLVKISFSWFSKVAVILLTHSLSTCTGFWCLVRVGNLGTSGPQGSSECPDESPVAVTVVVKLSLNRTGRFLSPPCPPISDDWRGCPGLGAVALVVNSMV